jgi:hypothetical protein
MCGKGCRLEDDPDLAAQLVDVDLGLDVLAVDDDLSSSTCSNRLMQRRSVDAGAGRSGQTT